MYADPQTVSISGQNLTLPRIGSPDPGKLGLFQSADGNITLQIRQGANNNRFRREFRLSQRKVALDPIANQNKEVSASVLIAVDEPRTGFTDADLAALVDSIKEKMGTVERDKLLGGEL